MHELAQQDIDTVTAQLKKQTVNWFYKHQHLPINDIFMGYFSESKKGVFKESYAYLIFHQPDQQMLMISFLSLLSNQLTPDVAKITSISRIKAQLLMNTIIYWLILYHGRKPSEIPSDDDIQKTLVKLLAGYKMSLF